MQKLVLFDKEKKKKKYGTLRKRKGLSWIKDFKTAKVSVKGTETDQGFYKRERC